MAKKIYVIGNYLYIDDTITEERISGSKTTFEFVSKKTTDTTFTILQNEQGLMTIGLNDIVQFDGVSPYSESEFLTFIRAETGFSSSGGVSVDVYASDTATVTTTIVSGGVSQQILPANILRKGFEFQNNSNASLKIGFGQTPSATEGFEILAGGAYNTLEGAKSAKAVRVWGATTGQRFTFIEY